jgi:hypothetical protein
VLGRGNGGMVRSGFHKQSGIPVAIKVSEIEILSKHVDNKSV